MDIGPPRGNVSFQSSFGLLLVVLCVLLFSVVPLNLWSPGLVFITLWLLRMLLNMMFINMTLLRPRLLFEVLLALSVIVMMHNLAGKNFALPMLIQMVLFLVVLVPLLMLMLFGLFLLMLASAALAMKHMLFKLLNMVAKMPLLLPILLFLLLKFLMT